MHWKFGSHLKINDWVIGSGHAWFYTKVSDWSIPAIVTLPELPKRDRQGSACTDMASTGVVYDVAVIGAGVTGSAAAYQIAKSGAKVVLLEQVANYSCCLFNWSQHVWSEPERLRGVYTIVAYTGLWFYFTERETAIRRGRRYSHAASFCRVSVPIYLDIYSNGTSLLKYSIKVLP